MSSGDRTVSPDSSSDEVIFSNNEGKPISVNEMKGHIKKVLREMDEEYRQKLFIHFITALVLAIIFFLLSSYFLSESFNNDLLWIVLSVTTAFIALYWLIRALEMLVYLVS